MMRCLVFLYFVNSILIGWSGSSGNVRRLSVELLILVKAFPKYDRAVCSPEYVWNYGRTLSAIEMWGNLSQNRWFYSNSVERT